MSDLCCIKTKVRSRTEMEIRRVRGDGPERWRGNYSSHSPFFPSIEEGDKDKVTYRPIDQNQLQLTGYPGYNLLITNTYGHFPQINTSYHGTPGITNKYLIYGHFAKINASYHGTPGTTNKYLINGHFAKINDSYQGYPVDKIINTNSAGAGDMTGAPV